MPTKWKVVSLVLGAAWCLGISGARGDGGAVRWSGDAGPWLVTILTSPNPLVCGEVEVSVLAQDRLTGRLASEVQVRIAFTPAGATRSRSPRLASAEHGQNKLYQSASFQVATPGEAQIDVYLQHAEIAEQVGCAVQVGPAPDGPDGLTAWLLWPFVPIVAYSIRELRTLRRRTLTLGLPDPTGLGR